MLPSRVVLGVEADVSSGGIRQTTTTDASGTSSNLTTVFDSETVRGRLGYAFDNVLLYGTGRVGLVEQSIHPDPAHRHA